MVAKNKPSSPFVLTIVATIVANAAVGPEMFTLLPPKSAIIKPAIIAVYRPCSGLTPEAIANAIESGSAIIATMMPATISLINDFLL